MKGYRKYAILVCSLIALIVVLHLGRDFFQMAYAFHKWDKQMDIGNKYLNSMTDKDIQDWIQRTQDYLTEYPPRDFIVNEVPPDLRKLGIVVIHEYANSVDYLWMGGLDHTGLYVERMNGTFQVTAVFNDSSNRVIWPKQP